MPCRSRTEARRDSKGKSTSFFSRSLISMAETTHGARIIMAPPRVSGTASAAVRIELELRPIERLWSNAFVRKAMLIVVLGLIWQVYARVLDNSLLFPTLGETLASLWENVRNGTLPMRTWTSLRVLLI